LSRLLLHDALPIWFSGEATERIDPSLLGRLADRLDRAAIDDEIHEDRRAWDIHVPDPVVHELEVPLAPAGPEIERDEAFAEEPRAGPMAAVVVARRQLDGEEQRVGLLVHRHLRPHAGVARV